MNSARSEGYGVLIRTSTKPEDVPLTDCSSIEPRKPNVLFKKVRRVDKDASASVGSSTP